MFWKRVERRLGEAIAQLADAQRRTEERVGQLAEAQRRTEERVDQLAEAQRRTEEQVGQLAQRVDLLAQRVDQLAQLFGQLTQQVQELAQGLRDLVYSMSQLRTQVETLVEVQTQMSADLERLKGSDMERRYRERAHAYFQRLIRGAHVLSMDELHTFLDRAVAQGQLSEDEADEITLADVVVRGRRRDDRAEVYLVAEVSWGVGIDDVQRASERAALLARTGVSTMPVVAGSWVSPDAEAPARAFKVWRVTDGRITPPHSTGSGQAEIPQGPPGGL